MKTPNLVGLKLEEGLKSLKEDYGLFDIIITEYTIPEDFYKKVSPCGVKRIARQRFNSRGGIELIVLAFNETPIPHP